MYNLAVLLEYGEVVLLEYTSERWFLALILILYVIALVICFWIGWSSCKKYYAIIDASARPSTSRYGTLDL
jgi:hypothetical protein